MNVKLPLTVILACLLSLAVACSHTLPPVRGTENVRLIQNVRYYDGPDADPIRHLLDIYLPTQGENWPAAVILHGGAFVVNDKSVIGNVGYALANAGFAAACSNYRLFPAAHHPAQADDAARAIAWVKKNLSDYGADTTDLTLIGYSAGATLAALVALDARYLAAAGSSPDILRRIAVISGIYQVEVVPLPFRWAFTHRPSIWREASPLNHVHADRRPWLVLNAEHDLDVDGYFAIKKQSQLFYRALREAGVNVRQEEMPGCNHDQIVEQVGRDPDSRTLAALIEFLNFDF